MKKIQEGNFKHTGEIYQRFLERGLPVSHVMETGQVCNLTTPNDLALANMIELRKIYQLRPQEMKDSWERIKKVFLMPN